MERRALLFLGGGVAAAGAALLAILLRRPIEPETPVCETPPPGPQPGVPPGWRLYSGPVSATATARARAALSMPFGGSDVFQDDDGSSLGVLVMWHCHDPSEGMTPVGWHKGATLFRIG
jgi:hypothetical protein